MHFPFLYIIIQYIAYYVFLFFYLIFSESASSLIKICRYVRGCSSSFFLLLVYQFDLKSLQKL